MIYNKTNYSQDLSLLRSCIYEYDIEKANISMLREADVLSEEDYRHLYQSDRNIRQITIGNMIKDDKSIYKTIQDGIINAKKFLFESFKILDDEVLSIRNDAIFITRELPDIIQVNDHVRFTKRNQYNLFIKALRLHFFYFYNPVTKEEVLDVKGLTKKEEHEQFMLDFIKELLYAYQTRSIESVMILLNTFYYNYCNGGLDKGYYRNLSDGMYSLKTDSVLSFSAEIVSDNLLEDVDISENAAFIRELYKIFSVEYLRNK